MIEPNALLRSCMLTLREVSGAGCVSIFVTSTEGEPEPTLLHEGDLQPAPELASVAAATDLLRRCGKGQRLPIPPAPVELDSEDTDSLLFGFPPVAWLALRFEPGVQPPERPAFWHHLFDLALHLAAHSAHISSILRDPITGLPDRQEFQSLLALEIDRSRLAESHLALLLINPDEFGTVNETHDHETGDRAVREIANRLRASGRERDLVSRYGGATFTVILPDTPLDQATEAAAALLLSLTSPGLVDGTVELQFSVGLAIFDPDDERLVHPSDLVRRADQALSAAKSHEGSSIVTWDPKAGAEHTESFDRMAGIFTGDVTKDYRNMMLLWDTIKVVAANETLDELAEQTVGRLFEVLRPDSIGLFMPGAEGELELLRGRTRSHGDSGGQSRLETLAIDSPRKALIRQAMAEGLPCEAILEVGSEEGLHDVGPTSNEVARRCHAVPLAAGGDPLGALFLEWRAGPSRLDASDLIFLGGLGLQIAMAWDRARLSELESRRQELEKRRLRAELQELRQAVRQARLVYRSPEMEALMGTVRRVANADATILLTGPSGTGKELLAHTIHELSGRRHRPLVIVDCGAIPTTLIESELFGHERGAYTGAESRRSGRLAEADGGTVVLDEIGELPLEVQSKLLRFVQDKQYTTVGGTRSREVDVRIVAATNRDLASEVAHGRFREDLYYRLNVVHLEVPPLRERTGDILFLARHFLEIYSVQYQKNIHGISSEASRQLLEYDWPGNVRELQNRFMRAVLLCEGHAVSARDLGFDPVRRIGVEPEASQVRSSDTRRHPPEGSPLDGVRSAGSRAGEAGAADAGAQDAEAGEPQIGAAPPGNQETSISELAFDSSDLTSEAGTAVRRLTLDLREALADLVAVVGTSRTSEVPAIGEWLGDELLLVADRAAGGVGDRGAALLDMPPSTYRRRIRKARVRFGQAAARRPRQWGRVQEIVRRLVAQPEAPRDLPSHCEQALVASIASHFPGQTQLGCALLGVTPPTYRKRLAELESLAVGRQAVSRSS